LFGELAGSDGEHGLFGIIDIGWIWIPAPVVEAATFGL
jgi:hypothetical protein